jgi:hypothetical protein
MRKFKYLFVAVAIAMTLALVIAYFSFSLKDGGTESCLKDRHNIPSGYGPYAEVVETSCGDFGGSNVVEVFIAHEDGGKEFKSKVFKYDPSSFSGPLQVKWEGKGALYISVERVDFILFKADTVDGYKIGYAINAVGPKRAGN